MLLLAVVLGDRVERVADGGGWCLAARVKRVVAGKRLQRRPLDRPRRTTAADQQLKRPCARLAEPLAQHVRRQRHPPAQVLTQRLGVGTQPSAVGVLAGAAGRVRGPAARHTAGGQLAGSRRASGPVRR